MAWHLRIVTVGLLLFCAGCVQFSPQFLLGSSFDRALLLWEQGLILEAREAALMVGPDDPVYSKARVLLVKIKSLSREVAREHKELGEDYEKAGIESMAIKEYRRSLLFNPSNTVVARKLKWLEEGGTAVEAEAQKRSKPKKKSKKKKVKSKAAETDLEATANTHYMRGKVYLESTAYPEAIEEFNTAREFVPDFLDTAALLERAEKRLELQIDRHFKKGISYFQKEEMELAVEEWNSVLRLKPSHKDALEYRGRAELIMERIKSIKERQDRQVK
ncbi:MAG: hypothetical protein IME99_03045 [Proteobacteria bacterium]|nr:hypothetical protein [Pseudomonadota bacterium]